MTETDKLNAMIAASNISNKRPTQDTWFSYAHQKQYVFALSSRLVVEYDWEAEEAIEHAQDFIDTFYKMKLEKKA